MPVSAGNRVGRNIALSHSLTGRVRSSHAQSRPQAKKHRAVNDMSLESETKGGLGPLFFNRLRGKVDVEPCADLGVKQRIEPCG